MKYKPFTSKHCMPSRFTSPLMQTDAVEKTKKVGKFAAKQGVKQALKAFGQKAVSTAFGVGGMLLSSQKAYAGPERKEKSMSWEEVDAFQKARDAKKYTPK
jgi:hypothetical protein